MKISILNKIALFSLLMLLFVGCNNKSNYSRTTGWKYNDKKGTGFEVKDNYQNGIPESMVFIEGGTYTIGEKTEFVTAPRNNQRRRITASSFYMDQYEIRNLDWREYTHWMNLVFGYAAPELVKRAEPDKSTWNEPLAYNEPYIEFYFTHPAYDQYPVVGVTWEQAMDYCTWRTDRVNENALIRAGIIEAPDFTLFEGEDYEVIANDYVFNTKKYLYQDTYQPMPGKKTKTNLNGEERKVEMSDGIILSSEFRLPTEAEWEYAAYGIMADKKTGLVSEGKIYPWAGSQVRSKQKKNMGKMQANFVRGRGDMMGTAGSLDDGGTITKPVDSFWPNEFGLYNMAGNVNEWVLDVYRSTSFEDVAEYNSFRGNVYTELVIENYDEYGRPIYAIDSLGRLKTQVVADMRNYKDGDAASQIQTEYALNNYFEGIQHLQSTEDQKIDITDVLAPRITDKARVYKGGSWKDRAYWLNPSARRFLEQDKSANDIGFRCAMSPIGGTETPRK